MPRIKDLSAETENEEIKPVELADDGHDLHPLLTNKEFKEAQDAARRNLDKSRREEARKHVIKLEEQRLALEEGMVVGDGVKSDIEAVYISLPEFAACLTVNVVNKYHHGMTYKVPRHVADSLREMMQRAWLHEDLEIRGLKRREAYQQPHNTQMSGVNGVQNAPQAFGRVS